MSEIPQTTYERITHEEAFALMSDPATAPAWRLGVELCLRQLDAVCALTRSEALAIADRHFDRGDRWAAAYWSGYVAAFVRYAGDHRMRRADARHEQARQEAADQAREATA